MGIKENGHSISLHTYFTAKRLVLLGEYRQQSRRTVQPAVAAKVGDGQVPASSCSTVVSTITPNSSSQTEGDNTQMWPMAERQRSEANMEEEGEKDGKNAEKEGRERDGMEETAILAMDGCDGGNCRGIQEAPN
jgi:hypothetical protein